MEKEYLTIPFNIEETKQIEKGDKKFGIVKGYAATFGNIDRGRDRIMKGAFKNTIEQWKEKGTLLPMFFQHSWMSVIGGFNVFKETAKGLYVEGEINLNVQKGLEAFELAQQKVLSYMSIGYVTKDAEFIEEEVGEKDGQTFTATIRNLKEIELFENSLVTNPMNDLATINSVKSMKSITDVSKFLKTFGISNTQVNELIYKIKSFDRNDSNDENKDDARNELSSIDKNIISLKLNETIKELKDA